MKTATLLTLGAALALTGCHRKQTPAPTTPRAESQDAAAADAASPSNRWSEENMSLNEESPATGSAADATPEPESAKTKRASREPPP